MSSRILVIDSCRRCPEYLESRTGSFCAKTGRLVETYYPPDWCPLPKDDEVKS